MALLCSSVRRFTLSAFVALLQTRWIVACTNHDRESGSHRMLEGCAPKVTLDCHWSANSSSVTQSPTCKFGPQGPWTFVRLEPFASSNAATTATSRIGRVCDSITMTAWVCSNAGVLLCSGGFDKAIYQEILAALRPMTLSPPLNTVLIMPDGDEEILRGMFELFEELAKAGCILRLATSPRTLPRRKRAHPGRHIR